jgi:hypothetical protein
MNTLTIVGRLSDIALASRYYEELAHELGVVHE